jgi:hypothetical protein
MIHLRRWRWQEDCCGCACGFSRHYPLGDMVKLRGFRRPAPYFGRTLPGVTFRHRNRLSILVLVFSSLCLSFGGAKSLTQPIKYNHKLHVQEQGLECVECHKYANSHARATIPNIEVCQECHSDEPIADSPEEKILISYITAAKKIPWRKVYSVPTHVYFSHRRHTTLGQIDCAICHGRVEELTQPIQKQIVPISMDRCMKCHEMNGIDNECTRCHR